VYRVSVIIQTTTVMVDRDYTWNFLPSAVQKEKVEEEEILIY
jgi:hypothetical protein